LPGHEHAAGAIGGGAHLAHFVGGDGERFFAEHVFAAGECAEHGGCVQAVGRADIHGVEVEGEQLAVVGEDAGAAADNLRGFLRGGFVDVGHGDDLRAGDVLPAGDVHALGDAAGPDQTDTEGVGGTHGMKGGRRLR
jgi:hypothetical protein